MLPRLFAFLSWFFFLAGLVGFAAAGYLYFHPEDAPGAAIDEPDREFPYLAVGSNEIRFRFHNPTQHPIKVVGYQFC
jgi:hypothetical protein